MLGFKFVICAESVVIDRELNTASVFNILEELYPTVLPRIIPRIVLFHMMEREDTDATEVQISIHIHLDEAEIFTANIPVRFDDHLRTRGIIRLDGLTISSPGKLVFSLSVMDNPSIAASYSIQVNPIPVAVKTSG
jgi:hypothetical protein